MHTGSKIALWIIAGLLATFLVTGTVFAVGTMVGGLKLNAPATGSASSNVNIGQNSTPGHCGMMSDCGSMGTGRMMGGRDWSVLNGVPAIQTTQVTLTNKDTFSPSVIEVKVGTMVTWTNADSDVHTVTFMPQMISSGDLGTGATFSYTFTKPGTYDYFCMYHQEMIGRVIVTG